MTKPTHLYTIFTEMMTHYYHFHQQNSPSTYHHRNKGSLIYLEQFQNHPIGIPELMKMHLKTFEHPRTPCFREYPPGSCGYSDVILMASIIFIEQDGVSITYIKQFPSCTAARQIEDIL